MGDKQFKGLFPITQFTLAVFGSLYFLLSRKFDFTHEVDVLGALMLIKVVLWVYFFIKGKTPDGRIIVTRNKAGSQVFSLELEKTPEEIASMRMIFFKVVPMDPDTIVLYPPDDFAE
jgi:hypothetical protein